LDDDTAMAPSSKKHRQQLTRSGSGQDRLTAYLREAGLRPTRQRMALAALLFDQGDRHVTAESLYSEALESGVKVSLATVYNALHTFTSKGILREISIDSSRSYFDTNVEEHHHFYFEKSGTLEDIDQSQIRLTRLPKTPGGLKVSRVDIVIRVDG
jgi:Fur family iron response transcriptional regulator